ncbi:hypothetical protein BGZ60DRAFT_403707 [Tricladium varicosporioides]|nr:hypothetical protein BGZ60DRAFT_403707 [Hymenoscyphus varicosporioides]
MLIDPNTVKPADQHRSKAKYSLYTKMPSLALSQQLLLSKLASNEGLVYFYYPPYDLTQQDREQSRLAITAKKCDNVKSITKAKIGVSCVNCYFKENRDWQGWILGKGITGSLNAFLTRIRHSRLLKGNTLLMRLLTVCDNCCIELDWGGRPNQDQILGAGSINKISASLVLALSHKEVEIVASSKGIIMEGVAMNNIKTVGIDGEWKEWPLLNKP